MSSFANDPLFRRLLAEQAEVDLPQLLLELAADAYPQCDRSASLMELDRLGANCRRRLQAIPNGTVYEKLREISHQLYDEEGFHGNKESYYDPDNSYLNRVLQRRTGVPITLGIVYMSVAARAGVAMFGTYTPLHYLIGCSDGPEPLFVDPFHGGVVLTLAQAREHLRAIVGRNLPLTDDCFRPATTHYTVLRVLRNLKHVYTQQEAWPALLKVQRRMTALCPVVPEERRDHGLVALRAGQPREAFSSLELYAKLCGGELDPEAQQSLKLAKQMVAELN